MPRSALLRLLCLGILAATARPLLAIDDRDNSDVTPWAWFSGQSESQIASLISANNYRIVDLKVENPGVTPHTFTVAFVSNSGSFAKTWAWYYDVDPATVMSLATSNNLRPVVLQAYMLTPATLRMAVVFISNTGADSQGWWLYYNASIPAISSFVSSNNARLTQISRYVSGAQTLFAVVMVDNSGANARSWWWYVGVSPSQISSFLSSNQARLIDIDANAGAGLFDVIMEGCGSCPNWWWYVGYTASQISDLAAQNGARVLDASPYSGGCSGSCFAAILINDSDPITTRVGELLRSGSDGRKGVYLKQVGGPVLASLEPDYVFEPASTVKVAAHLYAIRQVMAGAAHLSDPITRFQPPSSGTCPGATPIGTESLQTALTEMMWHSDNTRTREVITWAGGNSVINAMLMNVVGTASISINQVIGCAPPPDNTMTLTDASKLYEGVANGTLLDASNRTLFYSMMAGKAEFLAEGYDWTSIWSTSIPAMVAAEAPSHATAAQRQSFIDNMDLAYKAGNYNICQGTGCTSFIVDIALAGWVKIPFCSGGAFIPREYTFGVFIDRSTDVTNASNTFNYNKVEVLREQIHAGLASCFAPAKFYTLAPCRLVDTRNPAGPYGGPALQPSASRDFDVALSGCGVPGTARSVSVNIAVTAPTQPGYLTAWPQGAPQPLASSINFAAGQTRANNEVLPIAPNGKGSFSVFAGTTGTVHMIVDVNGYFQ